VSGSVFVIGGDARIDGRVDGDVRLLAGNLTVGEEATITGELQAIAGEPSVADGASVGRQTTIDVTRQSRSPQEAVGLFALQVLVMALLGAWVSRRAPALLANVGDSIAHHTVVSGVVGSIAGATSLVLFVYMAFTLILLPLSIAGLVVELLTVVYSYLVYGYLLGTRLPVERTDVASAVGVGAFVVGVELLGRVPLLGAVAQFLLVAVGLGAVLVTYFGLREFEPAEIPG
jgi:hypothetical protein